MSTHYEDDYGYGTATRTTTDTDRAVRGLLTDEPAQEIIMRGNVDYSSFAALAQPDRERDLARLEKRARTTGARLGARAFYSWRQGGQLIEGLTVQAAYALLADYGCAACRVAIVERQGQRVQLRAAAIDLINFVFVERDALFTLRPAPGKYADKPEEAARWEAMQEQSAASKAVRGAILRMVPDWMGQACMEAARTAASGRVLKEGQTVAQAAAEAVKNFGGRYHVTVEQMEAYLELPVKLWTVRELEDLLSVWRSLHQGEATVAAVFGDAEKAPTRHQETPKPAASPAPSTAPQSAPTPSQDDEAGPSVADLKQECAALEEELGGQETPTVRAIRSRLGLGAEDSIINSRLKRTGIKAYLDALRAKAPQPPAAPTTQEELV
jgi:hypothetical protein